MLTVGVDLAAEPANTAVARAGWTCRGAEVQGLAVGADDGMLVQEIVGADKAGIDCRSAGRGGSWSSSASISPGRSSRRWMSPVGTGGADSPSERPTWSPGR